MLERGRTPEALQAELARVNRELIALREVIDSIPHRVFWKDRNCVWMGANQNLARDCNMPGPADLVGKTDHDFFPKEHADFFQKCDREVMEKGEPLLDIEEPQERPDGSLAYLLTSKVPLRDETGSVIGMAGVYVDITERKILEQKLEKALEASEAAARAKSNFLAVVSHELRTPLALILGPLESILGQLPEGAEWKAALAMVLRNSVRLKDLVDDILDYTKLEAGKLHAVMSRCDVASLVREVADDATMAAEVRDIQLGAAIEPIQPLDCDPSLLRKITLNLVGNALKFTPPGGRVDLSLRAIGDAYRLEIADTGPGIATEQRDRMFERFEQADDSATRAAEGTGLGLALVKEFAHALGGEVGVESEVGRGSTFWVRLPIRRTFEASPTPAGAPAATEKLTVSGSAHDIETAGTDGIHVVVAEDNPDMRAHIKSVLAPTCRVTLCPNGAVALEAIRTLHPDVIVSDVMMPVMDVSSSSAGCAQTMPSARRPCSSSAHGPAKKLRSKGSTQEPTTTSPSRSAASSWSPGCARPRVCARSSVSSPRTSKSSRRRAKHSKRPPRRRPPRDRRQALLARQDLLARQALLARRRGFVTRSRSWSERWGGFKRSTPDSPPPPLASAQALLPNGASFSASRRTGAGAAQEDQEASRSRPGRPRDRRMSAQARFRS